MVDSPSMTDGKAGSHRGILVVISSPSGAGKTTLAHRLAEQERLEFSVSYTTRLPRPGETDGVDYKFVTEDEFSSMVERNEFAEWAQVHGNRYGTAVAHGQPRARGRQGLPVRRRLSGRRADPPAVARRERAGVHPAAVDGRAGTPAAPPRDRFTRGDRTPAGDRQARAGALRRVRLPGGERQPGHGAEGTVQHLRGGPLHARPPRALRTRAAGRSTTAGGGAAVRRRNERRSGDSRLRSGVRRRRRHRSHRTQLRLRRRASRRPEAALGRSLRRPSGRRRPHHLRAAAGRAVRVRGLAPRLRRGHERDRRGHRAAVRHRDPVPGRGRHQAGADPLDDARGAPGGELPQDAAGDGARHPRHPDQARRSRRQHADAGAHAARQAGAHLARDARDLRAARQPPRYPVDEGELEDLAFKYLEPEDYAALVARCAETAGSREAYIAEVVDRLNERARGGRDQRAGRRAAPSTSGRSSRR